MCDRLCQTLKESFAGLPLYRRECVLPNHQRRYLVGLSLFVVPVLCLFIGNNIPTSAHYFTQVNSRAGQADYRIVADAYIASGDWVFNCLTAHLVSLTALRPPKALLSTPSSNVALLGAQHGLARKVLLEVLGHKEWIEQLEYSHSILNPRSRIEKHIFYSRYSNAGHQGWFALEHDVLLNTVALNIPISNPPLSNITSHASELYRAIPSCSERQLL